MKFILALVFAVLLLGQAFGQNAEPIKTSANGVEFHYIEKGQGEPLVLLHGGVGDYRAWNAQIEAFSKNYRVIAYSRRFHYPNKNPSNDKYRAVETEAEDLKHFLRKLKLKRVHLVGTSYGAFTALVFAVKNPKMVHSLTIAEPPVHQLIRDLPGGEAVYRDFINALKPVGEEFKKGNDRAAMSIFNGILGREFDKLPPAAVETIMQNAPAIRTLVLSPEPFPLIAKDKLRQLKIPVLIVTGENTVKIHKLVNGELFRLLPNAKESLIPNAGHGSPRENPQVFNKAVMTFLTNISTETSNIKTSSAIRKKVNELFLKRGIYVNIWSFESP